MAALAFFSEKAPVCILIGMAGNTGGVDLLIHVAFMAGKTRDLSVFTL